MKYTSKLVIFSLLIICGVQAPSLAMNQADFDRTDKAFKVLLLEMSENLKKWDSMNGSLMEYMRFDGLSLPSDNQIKMKTVLTNLQIMETFGPYFMLQCHKLMSIAGQIQEQTGLDNQEVVDKFNIEREMDLVWDFYEYLKLQDKKFPPQSTTVLEGKKCSTNDEETRD